MEQAGNTTSLRSMAPHWSLGGDKQLLNILQDIHQKIMTRCHETNTNLEEMANLLDGANIDLQNVNNKFMALSNSQFIESRVYEDDIDSTVGETQVKANSSHDLEQVHPQSELTKIKEGLKILESMHECVTILNSDSESDTDDDGGRIVYKPKNLYSDRPLPHIIGSQAWKSKWHAGILAEDSDSDSSVTKPAHEVLEQYSESDSEVGDTQTDQLHPPPRTISSSSSMADSEPKVTPVPISQAHIAAELARKLGGNILEIPIRTPEPEVPKSQAVPTKLYKPQNPATSTIFFDEPPPLEQTYQSDDDDYNVDDDDDIFADLHKRKPSFTKNKDQGRLNEELFGGFKSSNSVTDDLFGVEQNDSLETISKEDTGKASRENEKKPVGGISLFGSSKGAESIGAAILKRNQSKNYSSDEESEKGKLRSKAVKQISKENVKTLKNEEASEQIVTKISEKRTGNVTEKPEKDILHDIFNKNKGSKPKAEDHQNTKQDLKSKDNVMDLFSDNLFDDIENIFTDNINKNNNKGPSKEPTKNIKSIFDDDDDDLFADIAVTKNDNKSTKKNEKHSLFDSDKDDDLFTDKPTESFRNPDTITASEEDKTSKIISKNDIKTSYNKETKSIFGADSDDIFCNQESNTVNDNSSMNLNANKKTEYKHNVHIDKVDKNDDDNNNQFFKIYSKTDDVPGAFTNAIESIIDTGNKEFDSKSVDVVCEPGCDSKNNLLTTPLQSANLTNEQSPGLFDDEEINDLFKNVPEISNKTEGNTLVHSHLDHERPSTGDKAITNAGVMPTNVQNEDSYEFFAKSHTKLDVDPNLFKDVIPSSSERNYTEEIREPDYRFTKSDKTKHDTSEHPENSTLPQYPNEKFGQSDSFDDIFNDVPPAFEKPKEPKKSRNINALFDDDSEDEALFFKKVDVISDEKPDLNLPTKEDNIFSIFNDEPPAIDCDSGQTPSKNQIMDLTKPEGFDSEDYDHLDTKSTNIDTQVKTTSPQDECNIGVENNFENIDHTKPVGKLKAMNININVNTLLPGASPKKYRVTEEIDGHVVSLPDSMIKTEVNESPLVKSANFEGDADSELLNNKLSKERAKIQVKRRPSTRKARREAVKKSGIDFGSKDSTDNSSSIDDAKITSVVTEQEKYDKDLDKSPKEKDIKSKVVYILNDEDIFTNVNPGKTIEENPKLQPLREDKDFPVAEKPSTQEFDDDVDIFKTIKDKTENHQIDNTSHQHTIDKSDGNSSIKPETNLSEPHKSKASIYDDMSDEEAELFHTKKTVIVNKKNIFGSDSEDDLFVNSSKRVAERKKEIQKTNFKVEAKKSLFDDDSDSDLFGGSGKSSGNKPFSLKQKQVKTVQTQAVNEDPLSLLSDND